MRKSKCTRPSNDAVSMTGNPLALPNFVKTTLASRHSLDKVLDSLRFYQDHGDRFGNKDDFDFLSSLFEHFCSDNPTIIVCGTNEGQSIKQIVTPCPQTRIHGFEIQEDVYLRVPARSRKTRISKFTTTAYQTRRASSISPAKEKSLDCIIPKVAGMAHRGGDRWKWSHQLDS